MPSVRTRLAAHHDGQARAAKALLVAVALTVLLYVVPYGHLIGYPRGDYLFTDVARLSDGPMPSDVANMSTALFPPYWFWGALCGAFSVAVLALGVRAYLGAMVGPEPRKGLRS